MIPKLYDSFDLSGTTGGVDFLGRITHCKKCLATEVRNGEYTLDLQTSVNDPTSNILLSQRIIAAKANPHDPDQYFEIQSTERDLSGNVKVSAKHVKNFACQLASEGDITKVDNPDVFTLTPSGVWDKLFALTTGTPYITDACPFTFTSDITATAGFYLGFNAPVTLGAILGGEEGSMLDMFGGEFRYNNYSIQFLSERGSQTGYALRYGKNISKAKQSETCEQAYSHIQPYANMSRTDGKNVYLYATAFEIPNNECKTKKTFTLDCTDAVRDIQLGMTGQNYEEARAAMIDYAKRYAKTNGIGKINVSIDVTTRAELDDMLLLGLCDTVKVVLDNFGVTTTAKITSVTYNTLLERWEKMTVGTAAVTLADLILNKRRYNL